MDLSKRRILIADDDKNIQLMLKQFLDDEGYDVSAVSKGSDVIARVSSGDVDLILMDVRMPEMDGLAILQKMSEQAMNVPSIMMTAFGTSNTAIKAMQFGAFDYITKPFELPDVLATIERYFRQRNLENEVETLRELLDQQQQRDPSDRIIGNTSAMRDIYKTIGRVARAHATVLITGETGAGKNVVAEVIHLHSTYRNGPFIKVTCAALPETLLESELFGHEKGSFTGAQTQKKGYFEVAHRGTIFLDEIGEMTLGTQKKLLHVIHDKEFERVGGTSPIKVDCRIVAATNKNLKEEVARGNFREDLYYRLNVINIYMPPLRHRKEDIPALVAHFLDRYRFSPTSPPSRISERALELLQDYDWPGNVRELENVIERSVVLTQGSIIDAEDLFFATNFPTKLVDVEAQVRMKTSLSDILKQVEQEALTFALREHRGNLQAAANMLGIELNELELRLRTLKISDWETGLGATPMPHLSN